MMQLPVPRSRAAAAWLVALALPAAPAAAQRPDTLARPPRIAPSGALPPDPRAEAKLRAEVTAPAGFGVTLFAGPPVAMYPTCLGESADDALYVCVDPNLSLSTLKGVGRVMRLVDADRDGRADRYTTFAEMDSPRGVVSDGRTVYVMHPPMLTAYRDTTGDGIADASQTLVRGLGFDLDFRGADHTTNNIVMGIDGWIYVAVGDYGFMKAVGADGAQLQHRGGAVVRVRPDGTNLELYTVGTRNIFDVAVDPFLNLYARDNTNDGDGWDTRLHYLAPGADMGYPALYFNFASEHFPSLHDYGAGSGVGGVWIQDPAWPAGYNNTLFTADWTVNKVFRHPLTARGASFGVDQQDFVTLVRPADLVLDARSNLYVASLTGGQFTYASDTVGYVFRVTPPRGAAAPAAPLRVDRATDAQLVAALASPSAVPRLHAQQELLRRGAKPATLRALEQLVGDAGRAAEARVAAMFTLKQLAGAAANPVLLRQVGAPDPRVRALALRALADRRDQLAGVTPAPFVAALADTSGHVQVQAINGLVRLGAVDAAAALVPLAGSPDQAIAHLAVNALASLGARDAALRAVDGGPPAARAGALRALARMHDAATVEALVARLGRAPDAAARRPLLVALARLYNREGVWTGDWWTTKPSFAGPYFDPAAWEMSPRIRPLLRQALAGGNAGGGADSALLADYVRNRVLPRGAGPLLAAVGPGPDRERLLDALVGRSQLDATALAVAAELDARNPAMHAAVAQLLAGESSFDLRALPLARTAVLDPKLDPAVRAQLLAAVSQVPGPAGLDAAAEVFARLNPVPGLSAAGTRVAAAAAAPTPPAGAGPGAPPGTGAPGTGTTTATASSAGAGAAVPNAGGANAGGANAASAGGAGPVEAAWRRFVGDRRRAGELDYFINLARTGAPERRTLAYAVLVQAVRSPRTPPAVRGKVAPVLDAAWTDPAATPSLVQAITLMRVEGQYADRLQAYNAGRKPGTRD